MMSKAAVMRFAKFVAVGLANTAIGLALIYALMLMGLAVLWANALGYAIGLVMSYAAHARWSFAYRGRSRTAFPRFAGAFAAAYTGNLLTVTALQASGANAYAAQAIAVVPYTAVFYLLNRHFTFRTDPPRGAYAGVLGANRP